MARIFISYRRDDTEMAAGRLAKDLRARFGDETIFRDKENIPIGADWMNEINKAIGPGGAVLVLIGGDWLEGKAKGERRLDEADDPHRNEIAAALGLKAHVIPVLVGNAKMPDRTELPEDLLGLPKLNALKLRDDEWDGFDFPRLAKQLESLGFKPPQQRAGANRTETNQRPVTPPPQKSHKGLWFGLGGAALALILGLANYETSDDGLTHTAPTPIADSNYSMPSAGAPSPPAEPAPSYSGENYTAPATAKRADAAAVEKRRAAREAAKLSKLQRDATDRLNDLDRQAKEVIKRMPENEPEAASKYDYSAPEEPAPKPSESLSGVWIDQSDGTRIDIQQNGETLVLGATSDGGALGGFGTIKGRAVEVIWGAGGVPVATSTLSLTANGKELRGSSVAINGESDQTVLKRQ